MVYRGELGDPRLARQAQLFADHTNALGLGRCLRGKDIEVELGTQFPADRVSRMHPLVHTSRHTNQGTVEGTVATAGGGPTAHSG